MTEEAPLDSSRMNQNRLAFTAAGTRPGCVESAEILQGRKTVEINHNGSTYRLQATRLGKLLLTK